MCKFCFVLCSESCFILIKPIMLGICVDNTVVSSKTTENLYIMPLG